MSSAVITPSVHYTMQFLREKEQTVFNTIPGMERLRWATPDTISELEAKYPDAAFALMIANNLHIGDREQNEIHQKAYTAILNGESITGVRFKYDYDLEAYLLKHMWD